MNQEERDDASCMTEKHLKKIGYCCVDTERLVLLLSIQREKRADETTLVLVEVVTQESGSISLTRMSRVAWLMTLVCLLYSSRPLVVKTRESLSKFRVNSRVSFTQWRHWEPKYSSSNWTFVCLPFTDVDKLSLSMKTLIVSIKLFFVLLPLFLSWKTRLNVSTATKPRDHHKRVKRLRHSFRDFHCSTYTLREHGLSFTICVDSKCTTMNKTVW